MTAEALSESAMEKSLRDRVIEKNSNAPQQINRYLSKSLDWDSLSNDYREYLALALGLDIVEIIEESRNCLPVS
jgi:hypothetical protein